MSFQERHIGMDILSPEKPLLLVEDDTGETYSGQTGEGALPAFCAAGGKARNIA